MTYNVILFYRRDLTFSYNLLSPPSNGSYYLSPRCNVVGGGCEDIRYYWIERRDEWIVASELWKCFWKTLTLFKCEFFPLQSVTLNRKHWFYRMQIQPTNNNGKTSPHIIIVMLLYADKLRTQFVSSWHSSLVVLQLSMHTQHLDGVAGEGFPGRRRC